MTTYTKDQIHDLVAAEPQIVSFTKVDGSTRHMTCTLDIALMPDTVVTKLLEKSEKPVKAPNDKVLAVYDIKAAGWRSFRVESVFEIKKSLAS